MCIEDYKIMDKSFGAMAIAPVSNVAVGLMVPPDPKRIGIIFCPHNTDTYWVAPSRDAAIGVGIPVRNTDPPFRLDVSHFGDLTRREWYAISVAGVIAVAVITLSISDQLLELSHGKIRA